jgi:hypothetical protein
MEVYMKKISVVFGMLFVLIFAAAGCSNNTTATTASIKYEVITTGVSGSVIVHYNTPTGDSYVTASTPYTSPVYTFAIGDEVSVTYLGATSSLTLAKLNIYKNGVVWKTVTYYVPGNYTLTATID